MKIMIVHSKEGKMVDYAEALRKGAESKGHQVVVKEAVDCGEMMTCHSYDLLLVGAPVLGALGGKIPADIQPFLSTIKRTEGQEAIAFTVSKLIGTDKGLRKLMGVMESQGCIVKDFRAFRSTQEAHRYGAEL